MTSIEVHESGPGLFDLLKRGKNYFLSWYDSTKLQNIVKTNSETAEFVFQDLFFELQSPRDPEAFEQYSPTTVQTLREEITAFFIEAFISIINREIDRAVRLIHLGERFSNFCITQKYLEAECLPGVQFLVKWLNIHMFVRGEVQELQSVEEIDMDYQFEDLPDQSKIIIMAAKFHYLSCLRRVDPNVLTSVIGSLYSIIEYDSNSYVWHYLLGNCLRFYRRDNTKTILYPTVEEIDSHWKAYEFAKTILPVEWDEDHEVHIRRASAGLHQLIAEIFRYRIINQIEEKFNVGDKYFDNNEDAANCIYKYIEKVDCNENATYSELLRAGEISFNILPNGWSDINLAERLLVRAQSKNSTSKVQHKLGSLYVRKEDMDAATKCFRNAVECSPNNVPAILDLLKTLMHSPDENSDEIKACIVKFLSIPSHPEEVQLKTVQGCWEFIEGNPEVAIRYWIDGLKINEISDCIKDMLAFKNRFKWPTERLKLDDIIKFSDNYLEIQRNSLSDEETRILEGLIKSATTYLSQSTPESVPRKSRIRFGGESDSDLNWRQGPTTETLPNERSVRYADSGSGSQTNGNRRSTPNLFKTNGRNGKRTPSPESWR